MTLTLFRSKKCENCKCSSPIEALEKDDLFIMVYCKRIKKDVFSSMCCEKWQADKDYIYYERCRHGNWSRDETE